MSESVVSLIPRIGLCVVSLSFGCGGGADFLQQRYGPCECSTRLSTSGSGVYASNVRKLVDGVRYDVESLVFWESPGHPEDDIRFPAALVPLGRSGMYFIVPGDVLEPQKEYYAHVFVRDGYARNEHHTGGVTSMTIGPFVDETPPVVGSPRVTGEVFKNRCGAMALRWEDRDSYDDSGIGHRLPVHVLMQGERVAVESFSSTYGGTDASNINLISRDPFLGQCYGTEGLETLDFELGESVDISLTLYDYSGNAGRTVTQTIEWPIRSNVK